MNQINNISFEDHIEKFEKLKNIKPGSMIQATVTSINKNLVTVDSSLKSESYLSLNQFQFDEDLKVGSKLELVVISLDDGEGNVIVSREKAIALSTIRDIQNAYQEKKSLFAKVIKNVRGGYIISIKGINAFLPGSLSGSFHSDEIKEGKIIEVKISRIDGKKQNIIASRKCVLEESNKEKLDKFLTEIQVGEIREGIVKNTTNFGIFVSLSSTIDGLVHIGDITWERIKHPKDIVNIGDTIKVKVLSIENNRISLGMKQLNENPWSSINEKLQVGSIVSGIVRNIADYGIFVYLEESGLEGLAHSSTLSWSHKKIVNPHTYTSIGQRVEVCIVEVNSETHRIALSFKHCIENPWEKFEKEHNVGDILEGKVSAITDFGIFVSINKYLDGLIYIADISWTDPKAVLKTIKVGEIISCSFLSIDTQKQRLSLGYKQIHDNQFETFITQHQIGDLIEGKVKSIKNDSIQLDIDYCNVFFYKEHVSGQYEIGDPIKGKIVHINQTNRSVRLSMKAVEVNLKQEESVRKGTVGDLIKEQLEKQLKK
jgi:small subunit ribosomal protein S1